MAVVVTDKKRRFNLVFLTGGFLILNRYIIREICGPITVICAVLIAIFSSYSAAEYLADAVSGLLRLDTIILMILLKIAIALEVLLPTALYLSVVIALGRMYRDSEMVALESCGVGTLRVIKSVFYLSLMTAVLVASISLFVRPWAYKKIYWLKALSVSNVDFSQMEAGNFYELQGGNVVIFAEKIHDKARRGERVFIRSEEGEKQQVIYAKKVYERIDEASGHPVLLLRDGTIYEFYQEDNKGKITQFQQATYLLTPKEIVPRKYRRKAATTMYLYRSDKLEDIAELQWRLSTPLSAILLGLLGVPLSRANPRQGKYGKVVIAVVVFAVYYNVSIVAKNWIEKDVVNIMVGIWWVPLLLVVFMLILLWRQNVLFFRRNS